MQDDRVIKDRVAARAERVAELFDGSRVWADSPTLEMVTQGDGRFKGRNQPPGRRELMHDAVVRWLASRIMSS